MAWREASVKSQREDFVVLAAQEGSNVRALCRRFGISPQTGYKWLKRHAAGETLDDRSRRPLTSPARTDAAVEALIVAVRRAHPAWGARKIAAVLKREGGPVPGISTIHAVLSRNDCIEPPPGGARASLRFEKERPNALWQMDFKGWIRTGDGRPLHPLTVVDDHSRFALGLEACTDQTGATVKARLERLFARYGLPDAIFVDNGSPWGTAGRGTWTRLGVWMLKLGVGLVHARPYHPQSRGKNERFHRTLAVELLSLRPLHDAAKAQLAFDEWRSVYNHHRPHEALGQAVPASRYAPSLRSMPTHLPEPDYDTDADAEVRRVPTTKDYIRFRGRFWKVPQAFRGERLALRPDDPDGRYGVYFASYRIGTIDLTKPQTVSDVSEHPSTMSPG